MSGTRFKICKKRKPNEKERVSNWSQNIYTIESIGNKFGQNYYRVEGNNRQYAVWVDECLNASTPSFLTLKLFPSRQADWCQICWDVTLPISIESKADEPTICSDCASMIKLSLRSPKPVPNLPGRHTAPDNCVQSRRADHLAALRRYDNCPMRSPKVVPNLPGHHTVHSHWIQSRRADHLPALLKNDNRPRRLLKLVANRAAHVRWLHSSSLHNCWKLEHLWNVVRMRKSESVCSFCLAPRNVTDPVWERTRCQDGPQEKTGMAPSVPNRTRQMPGQLSCPLRDACRKTCSSEGAVEA